MQTPRQARKPLANMVQPGVTCHCGQNWVQQQNIVTKNGQLLDFIDYRNEQHIIFLLQMVIFHIYVKSQKDNPKKKVHQRKNFYFS